MRQKTVSRFDSTGPSAIEFVDETTLNEIKFRFDKNSKCLLFVEYDEKIISSEKKLRQITTGKIAKKLQSKKEMLRWWRFRDMSLHYSLKSIKKENRIPHVIEDAAVPLKELPKIFSMLDRINKKYNTKSIIYGHAGSGKHACAHDFRRCEKSDGEENCNGVLSRNNQDQREPLMQSTATDWPVRNSSKDSMAQRTIRYSRN